MVNNPSTSCLLYTGYTELFIIVDEFSRYDGTCAKRCHLYHTIKHTGIYLFVSPIIVFIRFLVCMISNFNKVLFKLLFSIFGKHP